MLDSNHTHHNHHGACTHLHHNHQPAVAGLSLPQTVPLSKQQVSLIETSGMRKIIPEAEFKALTLRAASLQTQANDRLNSALDSLGEFYPQGIAHLLLSALDNTDAIAIHTLSKSATFSKANTCGSECRECGSLYDDLKQLNPTQIESLLDASSIIYQYAANVAYASFPNIILLDQPLNSQVSDGQVLERLNTDPKTFVSNLSRALPPEIEREIYTEIKSEPDKLLFGSCRVMMLEVIQVIRLLELPKTTPESELERAILNTTKEFASNRLGTLESASAKSILV